MTKLTTARRKALDDSDFALSGRRYPVYDKTHAQNAKARAQQQFDKGNLTAAEKVTVFRKANKVLKAKGAKTLTTAKGKKVAVKRKAEK